MLNKIREEADKRKILGLFLLSCQSPSLHKGSAVKTHLHKSTGIFTGGLKVFTPSELAELTQLWWEATLSSTPLHNSMWSSLPQRSYLYVPTWNWEYMELRFFRFLPVLIYQDCNYHFHRQTLKLQKTSLVMGSSGWQLCIFLLIPSGFFSLFISISPYLAFTIKENSLLLTLVYGLVCTLVWGEAPL